MHSVTSAPTRSTGRHRPAARVRLALAVCIAGAFLVAMAATPTAHAQLDEVVLYDDALGDGFADWSWSPTDLASTQIVAQGTTAIRADLTPWGALSLGTDAPVAVPSGGTLRFSVHGGENTSATLRIVAMNETFQPAGPAVTMTAPGGQWTTAAIPLADLGDPTMLGGIWWQDASGTNPAAIHVDDIRITFDAGPEPEPTPEPEPEPSPQPEPEPSPQPEPTPDPEPSPEPEPGGVWAFEETFDGHPSAPSQDLLPRTFDYVATHRSHPQDHFTKAYTPFLADHAEDCTGPDPAISPLPQRLIQTTQDSNGSNPDPSFFICHGHMMSSMGDVEGYSVTSFWPRQEFDFADGGTLEFDVSINDDHGNRSWWEVMIVPRDELRVAAGPDDAPISERYPHDRIVLDFRRNVRTIKVGTGATAPGGWLADETEWGQWDFAWWRDLHPDDPGLDDRRVRRTMRVRLEADRVVWGIETPDGSFDEWAVDVPGGLPFDRGLVLFKTHAYNPTKDGNLDTYTFHWDDIRFDGPVVGRYDVHEADDVVYLQRNGHRPIGDSQTVTIDLDDIGPDPVLFGQIHQPKRGQVLLSINGGPEVEVAPYEYDLEDCLSTDWKSFRYELDPAQLRTGPNTFTWTVGPRPDCTYLRDLHWDGFSVKFLQIQTDAD